MRSAKVFELHDNLVTFRTINLRLCPVIQTGKKTFISLFQNHRKCCGWFYGMLLTHQSPCVTPSGRVPCL